MSSRDKLADLDGLIEKLKLQVVTMGFPDPGNLKSIKRKDVKQRIRCIAALMNQR